MSYNDVTIFVWIPSILITVILNFLKKSVFGGPAWTYVESRKAWYFHQFLPEQPTLNLRSAEVKAELEVTNFNLKIYSFTTVFNLYIIYLFRRLSHFG